MPIVFGKLLAAILITSVAASIAVALGTVLAFIEDADRRAEEDRNAAA